MGTRAAPVRLPFSAFFAVTAGVFFLTPWALRLPPLPGAFLFLALGVSFALTASGTVTATSVAAGAAGAFAATVAVTGTGAASGAGHGGSAVAAGALFAGLGFFERTLRVAAGRPRWIHGALAALGGAAGGGLVGTYGDGPLALRLVAAAVAVVLASLPFLVAADDAWAHELSALGRLLPLPPGDTLRAAATLWRTIEMASLTPRSSLAACEGVRTLLRLGEARLRLRTPGGVPSAGLAALLDQRMAEALETLRVAVQPTRTPS